MLLFDQGSPVAPHCKRDRTSPRTKKERKERTSEVRKGVGGFHCATRGEPDKGRLFVTTESKVRFRAVPG